MSRKKKEKSVKESAKLARHRHWKGLLSLVLFLLCALGVSDYLLFLSPNSPDFDIFYHLRHASIYLSKGLSLKEFPWATYSVINRFSADLWYGFHLLLIPVTFHHDPVSEVKLGGLFILTIFLVLFYLAIRRSRLSCPFLWPFFLLFSAGVFIERLVMGRPHVISMGLTALLFSFMVSGSIWGVFFCSLALTFFHLSFFWLALAAAGAVVLVKLRIEKEFEWRKSAALFSGLAAGWLLRPNPIGAAKILYVQVFQLMLEKQKGLAGFGTELGRLEPRALILLSPFIAVWLGMAAATVAALFRRHAELPPVKRTFLWSSLLLSLLFFGTTVSVYQRTIDQWGLFAVLFVAAGLTYFLDAKEAEGKRPGGQRRRLIAASAGVIFLIGLVWMTLYSYTRFIRSPLVGRTERTRAAGEWLKEHAQPGEIVFHAHWDNFPELFFWSPANRYIGGMDPIFQYAYDPGLYWKARHLATNEMGARTWGTMSGKGARLEETYTVLRRDFKASYLFVQKYRTPSLYWYALEDARFVQCFDSRLVAIFRLSGAGQSETEK